MSHLAATDTLNFETTENQRMIIQMVRDFAEKHIRPNIMEWDESQHFPAEMFKEMGKLGLLGVLVPEEYGGAGFGYFEYVTAITELARLWFCWFEHGSTQFTLYRSYPPVRKRRTKEKVVT
jgi:alkylation response protein AidB-like acyl-CoA dehydrogenase